MKLRVIISCIALLSAVSGSLSAQTTAKAETGIGFSSWISNPDQGLSEENLRALQVKVDQIIARNGAGSTSALSTIFVIYPEFVVTRTDLIESGLKPVTVVRADLTLFAVNRADMSNYGSLVVSLQGNGNSEQECIRSMVSRVRPTDPLFARFIDNARQKIVDYYTAQTPALMAKAKSLADRQQYDDALAVLSMIPECMDEYPAALDQMTAVYMKLQDQIASSAIQEAKSKIAIRDYAGAMTILAQVDPTSKQFPQASALIEDVHQKIDDREERVIAAQWKIYEDRKEAAKRAQDDKTEIRKLQVDAAKTAANNQLSVQIKTAESSGGMEGLKKWFLGKMK